jgi:hypothetical protein
VVSQLSDVAEGVRQYLDERSRLPAESNALTPVVGGSGKGMAHLLFVSTSESPDIQAKADFVISQLTADTEIQAVIDTLGIGATWTLWFAGIFEMNGFPSSGVDFGPHWVRGLGWTDFELIPT